MQLATALRLLPGIIILALVLAVIGLKSNRDKWQRQAVRSEEARKLDRQSYEQAQVQAAENNRAEVKRIEAKQKEITDNAETRYNRDLAELRRLRSQGRANQGAPGNPGTPQVPGTPGGPDEDGLSLPADEYLRAQEIELRLMHLQKWIEELAR